MEKKKQNPVTYDPTEHQNSLEQVLNMIHSMHILN